MDPLGYLEFMSLVASAAGVLTDSGGIQEETTFLGIPCFTLRDNTERPVTVELGTNMLLGLAPERIGEVPDLIAARVSGAADHPRLWDGHAAQRIVDVLAEPELLDAAGTRPRRRSRQPVEQSGQALRGAPRARTARAARAGPVGGTRRARRRSSAAAIEPGVVEPRAQPAGAEPAQQRLGGAAVGHAQHGPPEREVLVDLARHGGRVAGAAGLRDERDVGRGDPVDGVVPARRRQQLDVHAARLLASSARDRRRHVAVQHEPERAPPRVARARAAAAPAAGRR